MSQTETEWRDRDVSQQCSMLKNVLRSSRDQDYIAAQNWHLMLVVVFLVAVLLFILQNCGNKHVSWRMKLTWSWCLSVSWVRIIEVCASTAHFSLLLIDHLTSRCNLYSFHDKQLLSRYICIRFKQRAINLLINQSDSDVAFVKPHLNESSPRCLLGLCSIAIMIAIYHRVVVAIAVDH